MVKFLYLAAQKFEISTVSWKCCSVPVGRVQSVALRLLAEREAETEAFKPDEWWSVDVMLTDANGRPFKVQATTETMLSPESASAENDIRLLLCCFCVMHACGPHASGHQGTRASGHQGMLPGAQEFSCWQVSGYGLGPCAATVTSPVSHCVCDTLSKQVLYLL